MTGEAFDVDRAVRAARAGMAAARADLEELVRIPSISASAEHAADVRASADATARVLEAAGLDSVRVVEHAGSPPAVLGAWTGRPGAPTVLLYAHHDVQPPGFADRWTSDPFEPVERAGRLYGRGSADDKAGAVAHAAAVRAWLDTAAALPCNVRVVVEGEEEVGSPHLAGFLAAHREELACDVLLLADAGNWAPGVPALTTSLRGLLTVDVSVRSLDGPLHSGLTGGAVPDPVMGLARLVATLTDEHGDVAYDGAWDDVQPPTGSERARIAALAEDAAARTAALGLRPGVRLAGDPAVPVPERLWLRPALTVIGLDAHPIAGSSNQVVAGAAARLSLRLAPGQDPDREAERLHAHLAARVSWGLEWSFAAREGAPAWRVEPAGPAFDAARRALAAGFGVDPVLVGSGGSIPFVESFVEVFGEVPVLLVGPSDPTSRIHGEDESLDLADWGRLVESEVRLLAELAAAAGSARP